MKKIISILLILFCVSGCSQIARQEANIDQKYITIIDSLRTRESYATSSNYYDISAEIAKIDGGYRYYVTIDNPRSALYDIEAIAVEEDVDYSQTMAANIGIFEDKIYSMIPNQTNPLSGYVAGLVFSGLTDYPETDLYIYVSFNNQDYANNHVEYFKIHAYCEDYE